MNTFFQRISFVGFRVLANSLTLVVLCVLSGICLQIAYAQQIPAGNAVGNNTEKAADVGAAPFKAKILRDGEELTRYKSTLLYGQQVNLGLYLDVTAAQLEKTKVLWTIPEKAFASYTNDSSTNSSFLSISTPIFPEKLHQKSISFFWFDAGQKEIQCRVNVDGKKFTLKATFTVMGVIYEFKNAHFYNAAIVPPDAGSNIYSMALVGPKNAEGHATSGIYNTASVKIPQAYKDLVAENAPAGTPVEGYFYVAQTQKREHKRVVKTTNNGVVTHETYYTIYDGQYGCDTDRYYPLNASETDLTDYRVYPTGENKVMWQRDTPGVYAAIAAEEGDNESMALHDEFQTYLMFVPPGGGSRAIALAELDWGWSGSAVVKDGAWIADPAKATPLEQHIGTVQPATMNPQWANRVGNPIPGTSPYSTYGAYSLSLPAVTHVTETAGTIACSTSVSKAPTADLGLDLHITEPAVTRVILPADPKVLANHSSAQIDLTTVPNVIKDDSKVLAYSVQSAGALQPSTPYRVILIWLNDDVEDVEATP